ncbi:hypothetical protein CROQUDRAFT_99336 [Cronartium quercuum f. sp. fusiforme G11]|uniref:Uncharacterized protein n=1 Tax=Cronartium quercuum f. sp. fusiforme G11 TaxID=708437 RepID=A0A9P6N7D7_9BASI|nr:hypothetical protein CROQUDRAFT_99336 [Cronartium quercuum f. sp. fusiforme G11]
MDFTLHKAIGQLAVLCNETGTSGIGYPTLSIVELTNIGFVQDNNIDEDTVDL